MPKNEPLQSRPNRSGTWKSVVELSAETEDLLYQVMLMNNFDGPDEAFKDALRYYIDSQCGVELNPELAASLSKALRNSEDSHVMTAQEARNRIHEWVLQASSQRLQ